MSQQLHRHWGPLGSKPRTATHAFSGSDEIDAESSGDLTSNSSFPWSPGDKSSDELFLSSVPSSHDEISAEHRNVPPPVPLLSPIKQQQQQQHSWHQNSSTEAGFENVAHNQAASFQSTAYGQDGSYFGVQSQTKSPGTLDFSDQAQTGSLLPMLPGSTMAWASAQPQNGNFSQMHGAGLSSQPIHPISNAMSMVSPIYTPEIGIICNLWRSFYPACAPDRKTQQDLCEIFGIESQAVSANAYFGQIYQMTSPLSTQTLPAGYEIRFLDAFMSIWNVLRAEEVLSEEKARKIWDVLRRPVSVAEILRRARKWDAQVRDVANFDEVITQITEKYKVNQHACRPKGRNTIRQKSSSAGPFLCTDFCGARFQNRRSWIGHEERNWRQRAWICKLSGCNKKSPLSRAKWTKQNYSEHLSSVHKDYIPAENEADNAEVFIDSLFPIECSTYFRDCDYVFEDWDDRNDHLAGCHFLSAEDDAMSICITEGDGREEDDDDTMGCKGKTFSTRINFQKANKLGDVKSSSMADGNSSNHENSGPGTTRSASMDTSGPESRFEKAEAESGNGEARLTIGYQASRREDSIYSRVAQYASRYFKHLAIQKPDEVYLLSRTSSVTVERVSYFKERCTFVRKLIYAPEGTNKRLLREAKILESIRHENVVQHLAHFNHRDHLYILMFPAADTDLLQFMRFAPRDEIRQFRPWRWFSGLASGLRDIHGLGFRHRDIKPSNILIFDEKVLFTDFGLSNLIEEDRSDEQQWESCTKRYAAPEMWRGVRGRPADVWSLGCVFVEIMQFLLRPFSSENTKLSRFKRLQLDPAWIFAKNPRTLQIWMDALEATTESLPKLGTEYSGLEGYALRVLNICRQMVQMDPLNRPTAKEVAMLISIPQGLGQRGGSTAKSHNVASLLSTRALNKFAWVIAQRSATLWYKEYIALIRNPGSHVLDHVMPAMRPLQCPMYILDGENIKQQTALQFAVQLGNDQIIEMLQSHPSCNWEEMCRPAWTGHPTTSISILGKSGTRKSLLASTLADVLEQCSRSHILWVNDIEATYRRDSVRGSPPRYSDVNLSDWKDKRMPTRNNSTPRATEEEMLERYASIVCHRNNADTSEVESTLHQKIESCAIRTIKEHDLNAMDLRSAIEKFMRYGSDLKPQAIRFAPLLYVEEEGSLFAHLTILNYLIELSVQTAKISRAVSLSCRRNRNRPQSLKLSGPSYLLLRSRRHEVDRLQYFILKSIELLSIPAPRSERYKSVSQVHNQTDVTTDKRIKTKDMPLVFRNMPSTAAKHERQNGLQVAERQIDRLRAQFHKSVLAFLHKSSSSSKVWKGGR